MSPIYKLICKLKGHSPYPGRRSMVHLDSATRVTQDYEYCLHCHTILSITRSSSQSLTTQEIAHYGLYPPHLLTWENGA